MGKKKEKKDIKIVENKIYFDRLKHCNQNYLINDKKYSVEQKKC